SSCSSVSAPKFNAYLSALAAFGRLFSGECQWLLIFDFCCYCRSGVCCLGFLILHILSMLLKTALMVHGIQCTTKHMVPRICATLNSLNTLPRFPRILRLIFVRPGMVKQSATLTV